MTQRYTRRQAREIENLFVQHHLEMCPDCREEYEALLRSLEATRA